MGLAAHVLGFEHAGLRRAAGHPPLAGSPLVHMFEGAKHAVADQPGGGAEALGVGAGLHLDVEHLEQQLAVIAQRQPQGVVVRLGQRAQRRRRQGCAQGQGAKPFLPHAVLHPVGALPLGSIPAINRV